MRKYRRKYCALAFYFPMNHALSDHFAFFEVQP